MDSESACDLRIHSPCGTDKLLCTLKVAFNSRIGSELLCELPALSGGFFVSYVAHSCTTAGVPPVKNH